MDPLEANTRWRRWTATGTADQLNAMLAYLDANLPPRWKQGTYEGPRSLYEVVRWFVLDASADYAGVALGIDGFRDSELSGGPVTFERPGSGKSVDLSKAWDEVIRFLNEAVVPAAREAGADLRIPSPEEVFFEELPFEVRERLREFTTEARGTLPLGLAAAEAWHEFVITTFRARATIDEKLFVNWLVVDGWSRESATELRKRLSDDYLLLSRFAEVLAP